MKNFLYFLAICAYVLGVVGGIGYSIYGGSWPIAIGVAATGYMAFPTVKGYVDKIMA